MSRIVLWSLSSIALLAACERPASGGADARLGPAELTAAPAQDADEVVLDTRADGAALFGRLEAYPENADPDRVLTLRVVGAASEALEGARVLDARFAASGVVVLDEAHELALVRDDGTRVLLDTGVEGPLSVEAERVAYVRGEMPEFELAIADLRALEARTLTQGMAPAWSPALSTDGREIVFVSGAGGSPRLYRVDASGGSPRALAPSARFPTAPVAPRWEGGVLRFEDELGETSIVIEPGAVDVGTPGDALGGGR